MRIAVKDASELKAAHAIQDQYRLTPLSQWSGGGAGLPGSGTIWQPLDRGADPLSERRTINRAMIEIPADPRDADLLQSLARISVGPGLDMGPAITPRAAIGDKGTSSKAIDVERRLRLRGAVGIGDDR